MMQRLLLSFLVLVLLAGLSTAGLQAADSPSDEFVQLIVKLISDSDREFRGGTGTGSFRRQRTGRDQSFCRSTDKDRCRGSGGIAECPGRSRGRLRAVKFSKCSLQVRTSQFDRLPFRRWGVWAVRRICHC